MMLKDILEFEKRKEYEGISIKEYTNTQSENYRIDVGATFYISFDSGSDIEWDVRNELGKEKPVRNNLNIHFKNEQDGTGDTSESRGSKEKSVKKSLKYSNDSAVIDIEETR